MKGRKLLLSAGLLALAVGALVGLQAADLNPSHIGSECDNGGEGDWHFVNNQTGGAAAGSLTATFADAGTITVGPSKVLNKTQHFDISGPTGPLLSASTNLPGGLVLSDLDCGAPECVPEPERCDNGVDDDCDELIDCEDPDCAEFPDCQQCIPDPEDCDNGADDDCDTLVDCEDPDCVNDPACDECDPEPERCNNGLDDDCDGLVDCDDPDCEDFSGCQDECSPLPEDCDNGIDDDCDGGADCADPECAAHPMC